MRTRSTRGIALISVLWVTSLLAVLAGSLASSTRTESRLARNQLETARAEALADAGLHRAILALYELDPERAWRADGTLYRMTLDGGEIAIAITDEDAKIDLNLAPVELLAGLFEAVGIAPEAAGALADRVVDFRDEDDERQPGGAEDPDYLEAGRDRGAKDAPFFVASEVLQVLGMTPELFERIHRHVTVFSGSEGIDPLRASPTVLAAIPGMTPELQDALVQAAVEDDIFTTLDQDALFDLEPYFVFSRESVFEIRSHGRSAGGGHFVREAVVELTGDPEMPYAVLAWQRGTLE